MKIKVVKKRIKQEVGIRWAEEEVIPVCKTPDQKKIHIKSLAVNTKCKKKVYIEV